MDQGSSAGLGAAGQGRVRRAQVARDAVQDGAPC